MLTSEPLHDLQDVRYIKRVDLAWFAKLTATSVLPVRLPPPVGALFPLSGEVTVRTICIYDGGSDSRSRSQWAHVRCTHADSWRCSLDWWRTRDIDYAFLASAVTRLRRTDFICAYSRSVHPHPQTAYHHLAALSHFLSAHLRACSLGSTFSPSSFLPSGGRYPISGGGSYTASPVSQFA